MKIFMLFRVFKLKSRNARDRGKYFNGYYNCTFSDLLGGNLYAFVAWGHKRAESSMPAGCLKINLFFVLYEKIVELFINKGKGLQTAVDFEKFSEFFLLVFFFFFCKECEQTKTLSSHLHARLNYSLMTLEALESTSFFIHRIIKIFMCCLLSLFILKLWLTFPY